MVPTCVVHPGPRHPCGSSPTRDRKGVAAAGRPSLHRPRRGGRPTGPGRLPPVRPGPASTRPRRRAWERAWERFTPFLAFPPALRRVTSYTTNAVRVAQPPSRAVRREPRPLLSSDEAAVKLLWPAGLQHPRGRRAAQRAKDEEHARPLAQGQRVDSSTGRVTTNRSAPPAGPPGSPPPTPTESTPTSDRTRLHRNIDRLRPRRPRR